MSVALGSSALLLPIQAHKTLQFTESVVIYKQSADCCWHMLPSNVALF